MNPTRARSVVVLCLLFVVSLLSASAQAAVRKAIDPLRGFYIVRLSAGTTDADAAARELARAYGGTIHAVWKHALKGFWIELSPENAGRLARDPRVGAVEEDSMVEASGAGVQTTGIAPPTTIPAEQEWPNPADPLWHLTRLSHRTPRARTVPAEPESYFRYRYPYDGQGVKVYIVDFGISKAHQELATANFAAGHSAANRDPNVDVVYDGKTVLRENYLQDVSPPTAPCTGDGFKATNTNSSYHGTAVAAFVAGKYLGVAKGATIVPVTAIGCVGNEPVYSVAVLISALDWVRGDYFPSGQTTPTAAVVNLSWYRTAGEYLDDKEEVEPNLSILEEAVSDIVLSGAPVVASANNQGTEACFTTPARLGQRGGRMFVPATGERTGVITVGGSVVFDTGGDQRWAGHNEPNQTGGDAASNYGQCVDLWAPGARLAVASPYYENGILRNEFYFYDWIRGRGTSFSAPMVSGLIARLMEEDPTLYNDRSRTAVKVMERLKVNATRLDPATALLGLASPNLLAYLGGVTFTEQPPATKTVPSGGTTSLKVAIVNRPGVTSTKYTWFNAAGQCVTDNAAAASQCLTESGADHELKLHNSTTPAAGHLSLPNTGEYWVRVQVTTASGTYSADSNTSKVTVASCTPRTIAKQPVSAWLTKPGTTAPTATFTANVNAGSDACYQWQTASSTGVWSAVPGANGTLSATTTTVPALTVTAVDRAVYRLVVFGNGTSCSGAANTADPCVTTSDTAQVHVCEPPPAPTIKVTTSGGEPRLEVNDWKSGVTLPPGAIHRWFYAATATAVKTPLIHLYPEIEKDLSRTFIYPPKPGFYSVEWANDCGRMMSASQQVTTQICYLSGIKSTYIDPKDNTSKTAENGGTYPVKSGSSITLNFNAVTYTGRPMPAVTWSPALSGGQALAGSFVTGAITAPTTLTFTATDTRSGCSRSISFTLTPETAPPLPPLTVTAGVCQPTAAPVIRARAGSLVKLRTRVQENGADVTDLSTLEFDWQAGTQSKKGIGETFAKFEYRMGTAGSQIRLKVTKIVGGVAKAAGEIPITFEIPLDSTACSACVYEGCPRRRAVRSGGVEVTHLSFTPGQTVPLEVPEVISGATYEWHRVIGAADQVIGTTATINSVLTDGARIFVHTNTATASTTSEDLIVTPESAGSDSVAIAPLLQTISGGSSITIDATFQGTLATGSTLSYEWREGAVYDARLPVIGRDKTLRYTPGETGVYWCRVTQHYANGGLAYYDSPFASAFVNCTTEVGGGLYVNPSSRLSKTDRVTVIANGIGKQLTYTWYRRLEGEQAPGSVTGSWWNSITTGITAPVNYFSAKAIDVCGTTGTFNEVAVYLCVPTIDTQPAASTVASAPQPLTVAVSPAYTGQTFSITWHRSSDLYQSTTLGTGTSFTPVQSAGTTESYYAAIRSTCGGAANVLKSKAAVMEICTKPTIVTYTPLKETKGETALLSVTTSGADRTFQWYRGEKGVTTSPISGETVDFIRTAPSITTNYWVRIYSRGVCYEDSPTMTVKVCALPSITTQPANKRVFPNKTATLTVAATNPTKNSDPLTYTWYSGSTIHYTGPSSTFTTPAINADTTFGVEVSSGICKTVSTEATVSLCSYPEVVSPAQSNYSIASGSTVLLSLPSLTPALPRVVSWYRGAPLDRTNRVSHGSDFNAYTTPPLTATTQYWAEFDENGCVSRTSAYTINVCKPTISAQPQSATILPNNTHTLSVTATPPTGLAYQWYTGNAGDTSAPIGGATSASYTTPPLTATTTYWVRITGCTTANSVAATVTVCPAPAVSSITKSAGDSYNGAGSVTVTASGTSLTYQWYRGQSGDTSSPITGATAATYNFTRQSSQYYWARVKTTCNAAASTDSPAIFVTVDPNITAQPQSVVIPSGGTTKLEVVAGGTYLTYQWYQGISPSGTAIPNATSSTFTTPQLTTATNYWCKVTSGGVSVAYSDTAMVTICEGPAITSFSSTNVGTNSWRLSVGVSIDDPNRGVVYHWYSGPRGDTAASVDMGESSYYKTFYSITQPATYWVRVWWDDYSCYNDTVARTLTPQ